MPIEETLNESKKQWESAPHQGVCPSCGYCPHCGRGQQLGPFYPQPYYPQPNWWYQPWYSPTCTVTAGTSPISGNIASLQNFTSY